MRNMTDEEIIAEIDREARTTNWDEFRQQQANAVTIVEMFSRSYVNNEVSIYKFAEYIQPLIGALNSVANEMNALGERLAREQRAKEARDAK